MSKRARVISVFVAIALAITFQQSVNREYPNLARLSLTGVAIAILVSVGATRW